MKPSLFKQLEATAIPCSSLNDSPRHWNAGLFRYKERLWMSYRFHRMKHGGRCGVAIVEVNDRFEPIKKSQHLKFKELTGTDHFEDARLFLFKGEPHVSYTAMNSYRPGVGYSCVMKYARLKFERGHWSVGEEWQPHYGQNNGTGREKNWVFFEYKKELYCVYEGYPDHVVLKLEGEKVVEEFRTPGLTWPWGTVRGGTPPVRVGDHYLTVFHSSLPTEIPPHFVRYFGAAYTFEAKPPFAPVKVSEFPLMSGSGEDGHRIDPRYVEGWKPFVVFPCGLVKAAKSWILSLGVNDWMCAIARISKFQLVAADGSTFKSRYYRTANGSLAIKFTDAFGKKQFIQWQIFKAGRNGMPGAGFLEIKSPREAMEIEDSGQHEKISQEDYETARRSR